MLNIEPVWIFAVFPALIGLVLFVYAFVAFRRRHVFGGLFRLLLSLLLFGVAGLASVVSFGTVGYRALQSEQLAATVQVEEMGTQRYRAAFNFPDGQEETFELAGDELYVDARILKWHPYATLLGMETLFELDRVSGRYITLDDEQTQPRTVFSLGEERPVDMFALAKRYPVLTNLVDAEYGSGTFAPVRDGGRYEVRVSPTGLLVRELE